MCNDPVWLDEEEHHRDGWLVLPMVSSGRTKGQHNTGMCFNVAHWLCVSTFYDEKDEEKGFVRTAFLFGRMLTHSGCSWQARRAPLSARS